jgi:hypothetical protein
MIPQSRVQFT